eukprot:3179794-Heterocapsa_arctica.AAC.1
MLLDNDALTLVALCPSTVDAWEHDAPMLVELNMLMRSPAVASMLEKLKRKENTAGRYIQRIEVEILNEIRQASEELQADREVVMVAVKKNGNAIRFASEELKGDRDVVMEA